MANNDDEKIDGLADTHSGPVPLTILSGFLGAGKTTLLNHLLERLVEQKKRVAIIQNEFSDSGVEDALVTGSDGTILNDVVELANGCVCCTVRDDFVSALETLVQQNRFEYFLLECSGLSDPGPLAKMFWVDDELEPDVNLDGVVTVIDAYHLQSHLNIEKPESKQIVQQIAYADRIMLNKIDLVSEDVLDDLESQLRTINSVAQIFRTQQSIIDIEKLLFIKAFSMEEAQSVSSVPNPQPLSCCTGSTSSTSKDCQHDHSIATLVVEDFDRTVEVSKLNSWLGELLWDDDAEYDIFRMKGVFSVHNCEERHFLQAVQQLFEVSEGSEWGSEDRLTRVVIIGRNLPKEVIQNGFNSIFSIKPS